MELGGLNLKRIVPHGVIPGLLARVHEDIDYNKLLAETTKYGGEGDDVSYMMKLDNVSTASQVGGANVWTDNIIPPSATFDQILIPYYSIWAKYNTNPMTENKLNKLGVGVSEKRLKEALCLTSMNQRRAHGTLFGYDNTQTQGIYNNAISTIALPNDSNSQANLSSYVPGELAEFIISILRDMQNVSWNRLKPIIIVANIDAINYIRSKIVPYSAYFQQGSTQTVAVMANNITNEFAGFSIDYVECSYMKGRGTGGKDVLMFIAPGLSKQESSDRKATNFIDSIADNQYMNTFIDEPLELQEGTNPPVYNVQDNWLRSVVSPGIVLRKEAVRIVEYEY